MDGFQRRREQKKQNILEATLALFIEFGIHKISISEIAKKANVSQVTIYNYFENKQNLIHEVFLYYLDKATADFVQILHSDITFPEKIKQFMFSKNAETKQVHEDFFLYIMKEYSSNADYFEKQYVEKAIPLYIELFDQGKKEGYVDPNLSNEAIIFFLNALNQYMQKEEVFKKILPLSEEIMNLIFFGVMGKREKS